MTTSRAMDSAKRLGPGALALAVGLGLAVPALAANLSELALPGGPATTAAKPISQMPGRTASAFVDPSLLRAQGRVEVWVKLADRPLAEAHGANARTRGGVLSLEQRRAYLQDLDRKQADLSSTAGRMGARELGRVSRAHNAVALRIDASRILDLASLPGVVAVRPVRNYELALSETVPYIGAAAAQAAGKDGTGARVAVLDSGIDYTHRNLGGPGTAAAYGDAVASFPNAYFPSAKVVGGFDFVGSQWPTPDPRCGFADPPTNKVPNVCIVPDPNPIDDGAGGGHGTHVSDIIAGRSLDGTHVGVAPGAQLYALKVCSSVSTSCNGVALLQAVDFALDPNGDGSMKDAVDVMNLSLGSNYGQKEDDLSEALAEAVDFGVVVVAAAGNAGNRPYIVSSPSTAPGVISVAQTQTPSAKAYPLVVNSPAAIAGTYRNTETVEWSPVDHPVTGDVAFVGRGCPAGTISATNPDDPYLADPAGKIALVDRGGCAVSWKIDRAVAAGATGVLIGLVAAGDAISFSYGGGTHFAPTLIIIQADSNRIKGALATGPVNATISPANAIPLVGSMVSSSARGPSVSYNAIKPEIGAPGASVSAQYGTGTGETAFGGTSGATPMVAGSAAILVGAVPGIEPMEVKARLMNTAETNILHNPALAPGYLAPITRIGAGEVRVDKALGASSAAWVRSSDSAALSFGYHAVSRTDSFDQTVRVENLGNRSKTYAIASSFRYAAKAASGAIEVRAPKSIRVGGRSSAEFRVTIVVHPENLPAWNINGGGLGGSGATLDGLEMDGYLTLTSGSERLSLPWQVLPHRAAALYTGDEVKVGRFLNVFNAGVADGRAEVFSLTGRSSRIPRSQLPGPGDNFAVIDLRAVGVRDVGALQFGISTNGARAHPNYPAEFDVYVDTNRDGAPDFVIFNAENGGFGVTGQNVVFVANLAKGTTAAYYYTDADLDSSNAILTAPYSALGITADSQFDFSVYACDNYFTGQCTDAIENMTYTPSRPRYAASTGQVAVPSRSVGSFSVSSVAGGAQASPSQTGFLLLFRDSDPQQESQAVQVDE
ncbi:MAG TPA: S8 family serine peptidase [Anaeromyxobacteraceae bacterium]|nr:S8 family serine peptidase [Anaeromyxobacteraceae bacterium]